MEAYFFASKEAYEQFEADERNSLSEYVCHSDVSGTQRVDLGRYNDCQRTVEEMQSEVATLAAVASTAADYEVVKFLAWILQDCLDCDMHYIVIINL